ncbi:MAG: zinc-ribbon domain-containing protein, partial [Oscillospiraceae bacterium]|nr:zinc-ribbon domain-containing protein [Oscillospiraceae bacterium]
MFCGNCGKKLIDGSLFCIECGTPVPVGRFAGTSPAAQQPSAFSGSDRYNGAESSYNAPNEADLFGTNSFSEEAISAFSGAMNAFGAQGFQVPTVEDVDLSTGRIRQKAPKNKGDDILVENFSMTDGTADTEFIEDRLPVVEGCSMDEDISKDVIIDPYRFLGDSMEDMSMDSVKPEMPTASAVAEAAVEPVSVEPVSFSAGSHENHFANLADEPDIQPSVSVEPVFPMRQNAVEPAVEEKGTEPVEQISVSVVEQVAVAVSEQAAVPVVEPITTPVIEQISVPAVEKAAEPVVEQAAVPKAEPIT